MLFGLGKSLSGVVPKAAAVIVAVSAILLPCLILLSFLDTANMRLRWCNAGHNAPILARTDGTIVRLAEGGPALSRLMRGAAFSENEIDLRPGDRIVLFTDGVSEATDSAGEMFDERRIEELVADSDDLAALELQETILEPPRRTASASSPTI